MKKNEIIKEMARQIIEDCDNHEIAENHFPKEDEDTTPTCYILCSIPSWSRPLDLVNEWQDTTQEERIEDYLRENGIHDEEEYDEDEEYNEWDFVNDTIEMLTVDNCKNSEFLIGAMWEFDGDIQEFWIDGDTEKELLKNIVENFKEYQEKLKEFKKKFA